MFTGLVEVNGRVKDVKHNSISVKAGIEFDVAIGDSVAVNGVCLTVTSTESSSGNIRFDVSHETIAVTNLADLKVGDNVNLERPLKADGRFHGHIVLGHVDTVAVIEDIKKQNNMIDLYVSYDKKFSKWLASKASIAINGTSLTVNECISDGKIRLTIIPHTLEKTNIAVLKAGSRVNIEFDILAKYVESLITKTDESKKNGTVNEDFLRRMGYGA